MACARIVVPLLVLAFQSHAAPFEVSKPDSIFSIVTHKAGIAARMAHNHLIYPGDYDTSVARGGDDLKGSRFEIDFPVTELVVDDPEAQKRWYPRMEALKLLDEPFVPIDEKDRKKIRETMLSAEQLDAEKYPRMGAKVVVIEALPAGEQGSFTHRVTLSFTVHGKTVERQIPARIETVGDAVKVEATGQYRFTEFGIEPFSAFMGAVKNKDEFDLYVNFTAKPVAETASR